MIVDTHLEGCCCMACWYDFGGNDVANLEHRFYRD